MKINFFDRVRLGIAVFAAKTITAAIRVSKLGAASVLPGTIGKRLHPQILTLLTQQIKYGSIIIAGTNGKTTTALLLRDILERDGRTVVHNEAGANLVNGLITTLLERTSLTGKLKADFGILEVDENVIPIVLPQIKPKYIITLNLFRDQLDLDESGFIIVDSNCKTSNNGTYAIGDAAHPDAPTCPSATGTRPCSRARPRSCRVAPPAPPGRRPSAPRS